MNLCLSTFLKMSMSDNKQIALQSLSMDLLRAGLGRYRGSHKMADRFIQEAVKRLTEIDPANNQKLMNNIRKVLSSRSDRQAEDLTMYSTLIRNRAIKP